jgi:Nitrile hydratase, alpha chain
MTTIANAQKVQEVIAKVWSDESLKTKLLDNPKSVLAEYGLEFPASMDVQVHENTSSLMNYVLPLPSEIPPGVDMEEIEPVAGKMIKLALADEAFKNRLLSDPKSAIAEATNMTLPMSLEIRVYEDTPTVKHLVLPVNPANSELSDADLELVAGGKNNAKICGGVGGGAAAACGAAAFTTPIAAVASGIGGGAAGIASAVA